jgi:cytochrome b561
MSAAILHFNRLARLLHWLMALLILANLFTGVGLMSTFSSGYHDLLAYHRPAGIAILAFASIRLLNRLMRSPPPLPADLPAWQRLAAIGSHYALYGLMFALPLVGWAMLSAGGYPITLYGSLHLPPIAPHGDQLYATLRNAHSLLALAFALTFLAHVGAALFHWLIRRDDVMQSMTH